MKIPTSKLYKKQNDRLIPVMRKKALIVGYNIGVNFSASNVVDIVQNYPVWGVDARSGVEVAPGVTDPVLLGQFIANARWAYDNAYVERHFDEWPL